MLYKIGNIGLYIDATEIPFRWPSMLVVEPSNSTKRPKRRLKLIRHAVSDHENQKLQIRGPIMYPENELWVLPE